MSTPLDDIHQAVDDIAAATRRRDQAVVRARQQGHTWRSIALAAGMTEHGVIKIAQRTAGNA